LINVPCLYHLLKRDCSKGSLVKSLNFISPPKDFSPEDVASFEELWEQLGIAIGLKITQNEA